MFVELLSTPRLPPVPEESTLPVDDPLYRSGMSVDSYSPQGYMTGNQNTVTMPTSQMSIHGMAQGSCGLLLLSMFIKVFDDRRDREICTFEVPGSIPIEFFFNCLGSGS